VEEREAKMSYWKDFKKGFAKEMSIQPREFDWDVLGEVTAIVCKVLLLVAAVLGILAFFISDP